MPLACSFYFGGYLAPLARGHSRLRDDVGKRFTLVGWESRAKRPDDKGGRYLTQIRTTELGQKG